MFVTEKAKDHEVTKKLREIVRDILEVDSRVWHSLVSHDFDSYEEAIHHISRMIISPSFDYKIDKKKKSVGVNNENPNYK